MAVLLGVGVGVVSAAAVPAVAFGGYQQPDYPQPGSGLPGGCVMLCDSQPPAATWDVPTPCGCDVPLNTTPGWTMPLDGGPVRAPFGVMGQP